MLSIGNPNNIKLNCKTMNDSNFRCNSCDQKYTKYYKNNGTSMCYFCYILKNIAFFDKEIMVCKSNKTQKDIIIDTYNYLKENDVLPSCNQLNSQPTELSVIELCRIYQADNLLPNSLNIRIIFTQNLNISNLGLNLSLFGDVVEDAVVQPLYKFSSSELSLIQKCFSTGSL
jgi:hypothetical protein